jgi:hypothetical protein
MRTSNCRSLPGVLPAFRPQTRLHFITSTILIGTLLATTVRPVSAASEVQGDSDNLQLRVDNASTKEALDALSAKFGLIYKLPPDISRTMTGTYSGTIQKVLSRILDGTDYIVTRSSENIEIVVIGMSGPNLGTAAGTSIARIATPPATASPKPTAPTASEGSRPVALPIVAAAPSPPPLSNYLTPASNGR